MILGIRQKPNPCRLPEMKKIGLPLIPSPCGDTQFLSGFVKDCDSAF